LPIKRALALAWLAAFAAALLWLALRLPSEGLETSIFELVPWRAPNPAARAGAEALRRQVEGRLLVLVGAADPARAEAGADAYAGALRGVAGLSSVACAVPGGAAGRALAFYASRAAGLLSREDRDALAGGGDGLLQAALRSLYLPPGVGGSLGFSQDPLGSFSRWLADNAALAGGLELRNGRLEADSDGRTWVAVSAEAAPGLDEAAMRAMDAGLERASAEARARGADLILRSGFAFHEHAAARAAMREVALVGSASTGLLALLLWVAFRRPRPMLLALLPAAVGCVAGAAAVLLLWSRVHAIALVFGSTVVGVADDYGLYFLSGSYDGPWDPRRRARLARGPLALAMATSVLGYAALLLLPIPALKQVAVFASVGLLADWAGVTLWYPMLTRGLQAAPAGRAGAARRLRRAWPRWGGWGSACVAALALAWSAAGMARLKVDDGVRLLYAHDAALDQEQARVQAITGVGGATGFFVVSAPDPQTLLRREEALRDALAGSGAPLWQAASAFVPSLDRQRADREALRTALFGPAALAGRLESAAGQPGLRRRLLRSLDAPEPALTPEDWLKDPVSTPWRRLWLPQADGSVESLLLPGPGLAQERLAALAPLAARVPGAQYVDQIESVAGLLGELRRLLALVLVAGGALVCGLLALRLGWRAAAAAAAPAALGSALALGALGWLGLPLNLFALLGLLLLLGTAVDFGIYMQDGGQRLSSFVAVHVAALTNIAAVGVLAFSSTPALRAFGLVLAVGCLAAWLSAPCFASPDEGTPLA